MAAKAAFSLACLNVQVSEDCVVETRWIETGCPPLSLSNESPVGARNGNFRCRDRATKSAIFVRPNPEAAVAATTTHVSFGPPTHSCTARQNRRQPRGDWNRHVLRA